MTQIAWLWGFRQKLQGAYSSNPRQKFRRNPAGAGATNRRSGGLVIDCRYELMIGSGTKKSDVVREIKEFLLQYACEEEIVE